MSETVQVIVDIHPKVYLNVWTLSIINLKKNNNIVSPTLYKSVIKTKINHKNPIIT